MADKPLKHQADLDFLLDGQIRFRGDLMYHQVKGVGVEPLDILKAIRKNDPSFIYFLGSDNEEYELENLPIYAQEILLKETFDYVSAYLNNLGAALAEEESQICTVSKSDQLTVTVKLAQKIEIGEESKDSIELSLYKIGQILEFYDAAAELGDSIEALLSVYVKGIKVKDVKQLIKTLTFESALRIFKGHSFLYPTKKIF